MRISELADIRRENVHLEDRYMIGGLKTDAGRNRIIPIHEKIVPLIKKQLKISGDSDHVFVSENGTRVSQQNLSVYMQRSGMEHTPHDTRHTFSSQAYVCGMDENILKRILGHALNGVTQQVYIHLPVEELVKAVNVCNYK
jgi:integrase